MGEQKQVRQACQNPQTETMEENKNVGKQRDEVTKLPEKQCSSYQ